MSRDDDVQRHADHLRILRQRLLQEALEAGGEVGEAERKAYAAWEADAIGLLEEKWGTADVRYVEFREALEAGADCARLFELRNAMHPKDPLNLAATADLREVGCYTPRATRREGSDG